MTKLLLLAPPNSIHVMRWVSAISKNNIRILLIGVHPYNSDFYKEFNNVIVYSLDYTSNIKANSLKKIRYLKILKSLKQKINEFQPDILHAHYASSYGLLGALCGFHPFVLSVWGSDIYLFPKISFLHRAIIKYNLSKANYILSTSHVMAKETNKYTSKEIEITPFGVESELFKKSVRNENKDEFIVGTVKQLATIYGIDTLIRSFQLVTKNNPKLKLKLQIIGDGPERENLQKLTFELGLKQFVDFIGKIDNQDLPKYYNNFSVAVFLSISESFGVVAIEAMACECPVIVSDAEGFTEVVKNNETGLIVPKRDIEATALAIQKFIDDKSLREKMGKKGRESVLKLYDWNQNVEEMINIYNKIISS